jgi:hypothetical protein
MHHAVRLAAGVVFSPVHSSLECCQQLVSPAAHDAFPPPPLRVADPTVLPCMTHRRFLSFPVNPSMRRLEK